MYEGTTAILTNGNLASLVAAASVCSHANRESLLFFAAGPRDEGARQWRSIVDEQGERYRATRIIDLPDFSDANTNDQLQLQELLAAVSRASTLKIDTVVWPLQCDTDLDTISRVTEMTILIGQLAELSGKEPPQIETPLLELTNKQMIELGENLGVPWELSWSCEMSIEKHCGACDGCRRRRRMFTTAGVVDPVFTRQLQKR